MSVVYAGKIFEFMLKPRISTETHLLDQNHSYNLIISYHFSLSLLWLLCRTGGEENFFHCNKCGMWKLITFISKQNKCSPSFFSSSPRSVSACHQTDILGIFEIAAAGCCYSKSMSDAHRCVERAMHHNCPVCFEVNWSTIAMILSKFGVKSCFLGMTTSSIFCSFFLIQWRI